MTLEDRCNLAAMPVWLISAAVTLAVLAVEHLTGRSR